MFVLERLLAVIAPFECIVCAHEGEILCASCRQIACYRLPERCYKCKRLAVDSKVCRRCRPRSKLSHVWIRSEYDAVVAQLIRRLKYEYAAGVSVTISSLLGEAIPYLPVDTIVTHIPTASRRYRQRGFDHAALLAKHIARSKNLRYVPLLARMGQTRQVGSRRDERREQIQHAFRPRARYAVKNATVLIVDDVTTTGATLEAAAASLRAAGAKRVYAAVFAQKL